jgi:tetratricopeptide (TPR) repeat protein
MKKQYDLAIKDLTEAIRLEPNVAFSYGIRGAAYNQLGQENKAIRDLEKALSLDPDFELAIKELVKIQGIYVHPPQYFQ